MGFDEGLCGDADVEVFFDPLGELLVGLWRGACDGVDGVVVLVFVHGFPFVCLFTNLFLML